jgi:predicted AlkP superfamily pyrophosphatase or phosphodiesterase
VLIISIDGLRPDVMLLADAPNIRAMMKAGAYSMYAHTVAEGYTLPAHVSMLTGVLPERHGVTWNDYVEQAYSNVPTIFELAKRKQLSTAMAVAKMKFIVLARPGTIDVSFVADEDKMNDADVAREAIKIIRGHKPHVMFVHFGDVDVVGHASGWGSVKQREMIERDDKHVGELLGCLRDEKLDVVTLVILTSDHGGHARSHGEGDLPTSLIPWIATGPGVRKDFDLTLLHSRQVQIEDTFATAAAALGIDVPYAVEGKPVESIYQPDDLLHDVVPQW